MAILNYNPPINLIQFQLVLMRAWTRLFFYPFFLWLPQRPPSTDQLHNDIATQRPPEYNAVHLCISFNCSSVSFQILCFIVLISFLSLVVTVRTWLDSLFRIQWKHFFSSFQCSFLVKYKALLFRVLTYGELLEFI